jgi:hypothetical protein
MSLMPKVEIIGNYSQKRENEKENVVYFVFGYVLGKSEKDLFV